jgi:hypothetical protein
MRLNCILANGKSAPTDVGGYGRGIGKALRAMVVFSVSVTVSFVVIDLLIIGGAYLRQFNRRGRHTSGERAKR